MVKTGDLVPHFPELVPLAPEKQGNGAFYGPGLEYLQKEVFSDGGMGGKPLLRFPVMSLVW